MSANKSILLILVVDLLFLLFGVHTLSISYKEALVYFEGENFLHYLIHFSTMIFGQNDYALRVPFIVLHLLSIILIYHISCFYLKRQGDRLLAVLLFVLLPGVVSSALLVNSASVVIFFTLLIIVFFLRQWSLAYWLMLPMLIWVDNAFIIFYLALVGYGLVSQKYALAIFSGLLFLLGLYLYGFDVGGYPRGYFLDTLGLYAVIFSPLLFFYFFYTMYRILVKEKKSLLWAISFTALVVSLLLSFRQRIYIEDFAPFVVVSIPLMVEQFMGSYRTRLPELRRSHQFYFSFVFTFLILNFYATYFNQYFYRFLQVPQKHFAYKYHIAYELAVALKKQGVSGIHCHDKQLQLRLKFYGVEDSARYQLNKSELLAADSVTISYMKYPIISYNVSKLNK